MHHFYSIFTFFLLLSHSVFSSSDWLYQNHCHSEYTLTMEEIKKRADLIKIVYPEFAHDNIEKFQDYEILWAQEKGITLLEFNLMKGWMLGNMYYSGGIEAAKKPKDKFDLEKESDYERRVRIASNQIVQSSLNKMRNSDTTVTGQLLFSYYEEKLYKIGDTYQVGEDILRTRGAVVEDDYLSYYNESKDYREYSLFLESTSGVNLSAYGLKNIFDDNPHYRLDPDEDPIEHQRILIPCGTKFEVVSIQDIGKLHYYYTKEIN